jgi:hypothetical protein
MEKRIATAISLSTIHQAYTWDLKAPGAGASAWARRNNVHGANCEKLAA